MNRTHYERLGEDLYSAVLPNGLKVYVVPRPGFSRKRAYFVTDFGSVHQDFELEGEKYHVPGGIAHYLEHKMFDLPGRDVSAELAALGASVLHGIFRKMFEIALGICIHAVFYRGNG